MADGTEEGRQGQVLAVAKRLIIERGSLNLSLNEIATELGVSRSLIYVYFESVAQIIDALFGQEAAVFDAYVDGFAKDRSPFRDRMLGLFAAYLDHLIVNGPLGYLVLRERNQDNPLSRDSSLHFQRILRKLSREVVEGLRLSPRETFVFLELLAAIPESLARMVGKGKLEAGTAHATVALLVGAALDSFEVSGD